MVIIDNKKYNIYGQNAKGEVFCIGIRSKNGGIVNLPIVEEDCVNKGKINMKKIVGFSVVFYNQKISKFYDVKVLKYIKAQNAKFEVSYKNKEPIEVLCSNFINKCHLKNILKEYISKNIFVKEGNHFALFIETIGTKHENTFEGEKIKILFDGDDATVAKIMNSTWCLVKKGESGYYVTSSNFNQTGKNLDLHQAVFGTIKKGNVVNHIDRNNNGWRDNRMSNLEETTKKENSKNKINSGYPLKHSNGWYYQVSIDGYVIVSPLRYHYEEANQDSLIIQKHFKITHRQKEWGDIIKNEDYIKELIFIMEAKLKVAKENQGKNFNKNRYELIELDGREAVKVYNSKGDYTIIDKEDMSILNEGKILSASKGYWNIRILKKHIMLQRFILGFQDTNEDAETHIDHLNRIPNDNRKSNLLLTTIKGNLANKDSKGYGVSKGKYRVCYRCWWEYLSKHNLISKVKCPTFNTEIEAILEVKRRKWLVNYIRPQFKTYQEYLIFKQEYDSHNINLSLDDYWITTRFPNINEIEIPKFDIDKL